MHLELFVEEPSAEAALEILVPKILGPAVSFRIYPHQGKPDLLHKLPARLKGYRSWLPESWHIVVLLDADGAACRRIKADLERMVTEAGLTTRAAAADRFQVLTRIAIEELEAWYFGDVEAICAAYPGVPSTLAAQAPYRDPDAIRGGTWQALERVLNRAGHHPGGLAKIRAARDIGCRMDPGRNRSRSFQAFREGLVRLAGLEAAR